MYEERCKKDWIEQNEISPYSRQIPKHVKFCAINENCLNEQPHARGKNCDGNKDFIFM